MSKNTQTPVPPVHKIRHGAVSASIWQQDTAKGPMFNVTFQRSYREGKDWKNADSFGRKELLVLSLIAARAFEWISAQAAPAGRRATTGADEYGAN